MRTPSITFVFLVGMSELSTETEVSGQRYLLKTDDFGSMVFE